MSMASPATVSNFFQKQWTQDHPRYISGVVACTLIPTTFLEIAETQGQSVEPGEKARRKFSSTGGRAPGYRLSPDHFQTVKWMLAPDWAQKMLCIIVPNRGTASPEFFSWVRTRRDSYWLDHGLSGSCTKQMNAVRKLSVWYKHFISKYWLSLH